MTEWLMTAQMGVVALIVIFGPGLATAYAVGLRGLIAWGSAPMMSGAIIAIAAIVAPLVGLNWSIWVLAGATVIFTAICYGMWRLSGRWRGPVVRSSPRLRRRILLVTGTATLVSIAFEVQRLFKTIGSPNTPAVGLYDDPYHLNSVMLMLQTGDASSLHMDLTSGGKNAYYPAVWHDITALVAQLTGANVPAAANWVSIVLSCVAWPLALLALGRFLLGPRPWALALIGVLSFAFSQYPILLFGWGIVYPNMAAIAFLPAMLTAIMLVLYRCRGRGRWAPLTVVGAGCIAFLFTQPNGLFAIAYLMIPILAFLAWDISRKLYRRQGRSWRLAVPWVTMLAICVVAYFILGLFPRVAEFRTQVSWPATSSRSDAIKDVISLALTMPEPIPNVAMAVAVFVGFIVALTVRRWRWVAVGYVVLGWLYVVSASGSEHMRELITGYWYGDQQRLVAQLPVLGIPLAAIGIYTVVHMVSEFLLKRQPSLSFFRRLAGVPVLTGLVGVLVIVGVPRTAESKAAYKYTADMYDESPAPSVGGSSSLVDADSKAMMDDIERIVPAGQKIANNPWEGSILIWPIANREPLYPFPNIDWTSDQRIIATELNQANWNPEVCPALKREDVHYVLRAARVKWAPPDIGYTGLNGIVDAGVAKLVASDGDTRLYEITACGDY